MTEIHNNIFFINQLINNEKSVYGLRPKYKDKEAFANESADLLIVWKM